MPIHRIVLFLIMMIYILSPKMMDWWMYAQTWYAPYAAWFFLILSTMLLSDKQDSDEF